MRLLSLIFIALAALATLAIGLPDDQSVAATAGTPPQRDPKAERLQAAAANFEARLERPFDQKRLETALLKVEEQIKTAKAKDEIELDYGDSTLILPELYAFRSWNMPLHVNSVKGSLLDFEDESNPFHIIVNYANALKANDIDFLVVPIPTRLDLYPERLPGISRDEAYRGGNRGMMRFMLELTRNGVEVVDLYEAFELHRYSNDPDDDRELYFQREYHWTQRAVELAADTIAPRIRGRASFSPGTLKSGVDWVTRKERGAWNVYSQGGSSTVELLFRRVVKPDGSRALQRDRKSDLLILGDSFMVLFREQNADLASHLFARLERPIDLVAMSGGGGKGVWSTVARRKNNLAGKRLVIWEFTSRELTNPSTKPVKIFEH